RAFLGSAAPAPGRATRLAEDLAGDRPQAPLLQPRMPGQAQQGAAPAHRGIEHLRGQPGALVPARAGRGRGNVPALRRQNRWFSYTGRTVEIAGRAHPVEPFAETDVAQKPLLRA